MHFTLDSRVSAELVADWSRLGLARLPLDVVECEDRRLGRAVLELAAEAVADQETELTILLPRRGFATGWHRLLHDGTADRIAAGVAQLHHVNATVVPYQLAGGWFSKRRAPHRETTNDELANATADPFRSLAGRAARRAADRQAMDIFLRKGGIREPCRGDHAHRPGGVASACSDRRPGQLGADPAQGRHLEPRVCPADGTGKIPLVFQGRRQIAGIEPGARLVVEGMVGDWSRRQAILNPSYELVQASSEDDGPARVNPSVNVGPSYRGCEPGL